MPPSNFRVIDTTSTSVAFQWDTLSNQQANGVVQQYVITCTERSTNTEVTNIIYMYICMLVAYNTTYNNYIHSSYGILHWCTCECFNSFKLLLSGQTQEEQSLG